MRRRAAAGAPGLRRGAYHHGNLRAALFYNVARSVVNLSYAIDRAFWGFSSLGFHITNGVLHVLVVGLFYAWRKQVLRWY